MKSRFVVLVFVFAGLLFLFSELSGFANEPSEKPGWKLGDRWVFNYKNGLGFAGTFKTEILGQVRHEKRPCWVVELLLELSGLRAEQHQYILVENFDLLGVETMSSIGAISPVSNQLVSLEPPMKSYRWPIKVGQKWSGDFRIVMNGFVQGEMTYEVEVVSREAITVAAGKFETFKIVETLISQQGSKYKREKWYSPQAQNVVKEISYLSNGSLEYVKELRDYHLR